MEENNKLSLNYEENGSVVIEIDVYNSSHFGLIMGNACLHVADNIDSIEIDNILDDLMIKAKEHGFNHITFKIDTNKKNIIQSLIRHQFLLVDTLVSYVFDLEKNKIKKIEHMCSFKEPNIDDLQILMDISKKSFKIDRFHSDPSLNNDLCDEYYEKWIENSYNGFADKLIIPYVDGLPVGYTTGRLPAEGSDIGALVLSAVSSNCRGRGIYTSMIYEGIKWLEGKSRYVKVGTQVDNVAVQKAWIKLGFTVCDSQYIFQKDIT